MVERAAGGRRNRRRPGVIAALAAALALLVFAAFLVASFPYDEMASAILAPYRLKLVYREQHLRLPFGVALAGVGLVSIDGSPSHLLLQSPNVALRPTLGSLLLGRPALGLYAEVYRGTVSATLTQEAGGMGVNFEARALSLHDSRPLSQFGALLGGTLSAGGSARIHGPSLTENMGQATIDGRGVTVEVTRGFPLIHLGSVRGRVLLDNGVLSFRDLESHGGDVEAKADGEIELAADPADSTVAARVNLRPTASGRAHFGLLFNMLPHPPSAGAYEVRGPLRSPSIS